MSSLELIGTIISVSLPIITSIPLTLLVDNHRAKEPRLRIIAMIRSGSKAIDEFYVDLRKHAKYSLLPTAALLTLGFSLVVYTDFATYLPSLSVILSLVIIIGQMRFAINPKYYALHFDNKPLLSILYGSRQYYWGILTALYSYVFAVAFYSSFFKGSVWGIAAFQLSGINYLTRFYDSAYIAIGVILLMLIAHLLILVFLPRDRGKSLFLPLPFDLKKFKVDREKRTVIVDTNDINKVLRNVKRLEDLEDYIFRISNVKSSFQYSQSVAS